MRRRVFARVVVAAVLGMLLLSTAGRLCVWRDARRVWAEAVRLAPDKPRPWVNLGRVYQLRGHDALAIDAYETAMRLSLQPSRGPDERVIGRSMAEANLALIRFTSGDRADAEALVAAALTRNPSDPDLARVARVIRGPQ